MPTHETTPNGAPCWVELMTSDVERSRAFYCSLFGWTMEETSQEFGGYANFLKDGVRIAGSMASQPGQGESDVWSVYLSSDDAAKTCELAAANGAQVYVEPMAVADLGTMAFLGDPAGAAVGVWQPGTHKGFGITSEAGAPSWFELLTKDYDTALDFYRTVFGWQTHVVSDTADLRYTTLLHGEDWLAGVMDAAATLPDGVPGMWSVYFGVDDTDEALKRVVDLGGSIDVPAEDSEYGRIATVSDPTGARFQLVAPNEAMPAR